jgi:cytochrome oxidase Cu insertion factor (SCO1/SenC/PrrC family)
MEPRKTVVTGVMLVLVIVGISIGASVFAFKPSTDTYTTEQPQLTGITTDRDLLELGLQVPGSWTFNLSNGSTVNLNNLTGKVILVDLMTTWCGTCATQNSNLQTIYDTLGGQVYVLSLTVDRTETIAMMADYKSAKHLSWDHGVDTGSSFSNYFKVTSVPTMVLIDGNGYFRYVHIGLWSVASISARITSIS